ncbi:MAG: hypothetical protein US54_C0007G0038 [Candidatus Roizmanbacteria bacterium GW2011_GWA2_37_7]|uniref:RnfC Barrel sandwich hybrid domain-containing protein n=1 Tax=Candidatus Roizmanbacteria bacterium GW2011_GWA2_37_7 TaxID=1618481 RepID=A0A0G0H5V9_9BACT|nr:MAG: hypothetical protein US54_C0007G0038 [Candidatus Roizmanbacteria bacterium GW2011_GWA2_37_7]
MSTIIFCLKAIMKIKVKTPEKTKMLVEPGQKVDFSTPMSQILQKHMVYIPIAEMMGFDPKNIFQHLKHVIGDNIQKGDILAEHKSLFTTKQYLSEISGVLREIKHDAGTIAIEQEEKDSSTTNCYFIGEIDGIYDGFLELNVNDVHTAKLYHQTPYFGASIFYLDPSGKYSDDDLEDACIFAPAVNPIDAVKMETLGACGLITKSKIPTDTKIYQVILADNQDFEHIQKKEYPYLLIGHEPMTVIFYN